MFTLFDISEEATHPLKSWCVYYISLCWLLIPVCSLRRLMMMTTSRTGTRDFRWPGSAGYCFRKLGWNVAAVEGLVAGVLGLDTVAAPNGRLCWAQHCFCFFICERWIWRLYGEARDRRQWGWSAMWLYWYCIVPNFPFHSNICQLRWKFPKVIKLLKSIENLSRSQSSRQVRRSGRRDRFERSQLACNVFVHLRIGQEWVDYNLFDRSYQPGLGSWGSVSLWSVLTESCSVLASSRPNIQNWRDL